ncbi:MAG: ribonuclease H-like domain-containing protein [Anaerolineaceae bacterium]|nr:ribonuclease H-like domain-containing protein [Anaerolineaceae bacterium]
MPSLMDRLNTLGLKKGTEVDQPKAKANNTSMVDAIGECARTIENQLGNVVMVEKSYPYGYMHGVIEFEDMVNVESIHKAGRLNNGVDNLKKMIFLDTETTGLSGGTGTMAFLVGIARFDDEGLKLTQFLVEDPSEEAAMLLEFANQTSDIEAVITFNGKSFDMPLLKSRYVINRLPIHFTEWGHLDLLHLSRRIWRQRLASRSLKDLEIEILNIPRSEDEVPGWMIPEIYFNYIRSGDASQIANVVYHNAMDIVSLAALYFAITQMLDKDLFTSKLHSWDVFAIGQLYEVIGEVNKSITIYEHCLQLIDIEQSKKQEINSRLAKLYKKTACWQKAKVLWETNGNSGDIEACIELAKYYEHEMRDVPNAFVWTHLAEANLENSNIIRYKKKAIQSELKVRRLRLEKRMINVSEKNS